MVRSPDGPVLRLYLVFLAGVGPAGPRVKASAAGQSAGRTRDGHHGNMAVGWAGGNHPEKAVPGVAVDCAAGGSLAGQWLGAVRGILRFETAVQSLGLNAQGGPNPAQPTGIFFHLFRADARTRTKYGHGPSSFSSRTDGRLRGWRSPPERPGRETASPGRHLLSREAAENGANFFSESQRGCAGRRGGLSLAAPRRLPVELPGSKPISLASRASLVSLR